ncbi:MAG: T9SS type A sorting domain-containing protein [Calditrichia bacterium]
MLYQNYPNPFNSGTTIEFYLPLTSEINVEIYNLLGQKVRTLWQGRQMAGQYQLRWDGRDETGREVASGVYIYRMQSRGFVQSRKMLFLK